MPSEQVGQAVDKPTYTVEHVCDSIAAEVLQGTPDPTGTCATANVLKNTGKYKT